jgi:5'-phosphate synthase pdxT subunit
VNLAAPGRSGREAEHSVRIGVLASQGDFEAHSRVLKALGAEPVEVRTPGQLEDLDGLIIPGGESTTITKALARDGLDEAIGEFATDGGALLGTCAGMIVLDRTHLGILDIDAQRNAFGRQRQSFEHDLEIEGIGPEPLRAVFIRAPWVADRGPEVQVLAEYDGHPVVVRQGRTLACSFHPELTGDDRLHALFMAIAEDDDRNPEEARALSD